MRLGQILRRWTPPVVLGVVALVAWEAADRANFDPVDPEPVVYEQTLATPMLSARRAPRTLRAPVSDEQIGVEIDRIVLPLAAEQACVVVRNGDRFLGRTQEATGGLVPASNQKVLTTWAALDVLGPDFTFTTRVAVTAPPVDGVVEGDLHLIGGGDPFLYTDDWLPQYEDVIDGRHHTRLETLADAVAAAGITQVTGAVIGDESLFDAERYGPWDNRLINQKQSGPLSALSVNEGFVDWPEVYQAAAFRSETDDPAVHAAAVFNQLLQQRAVAVGAPPATGVTPVDAVEVASITSPPLTDIVTHINAFSSNLGAELLLKRIGLETSGIGSTAAGAAAVADLLERRGVPLQDVIVVDGSGLAETNRLTCSALAAVLAEAGPETPLGRSLAVGGVRGSLLERFVDSPATGRVLAKTGTLRGVKALSGYVLSADADSEGQWVTFAQILNDDEIIDDELVAAVQEPLVEALTTYPSGPTIDQLSPAEAVPR